MITAMSKLFKKALADIVGRELESKGFVLASVKCHQGYPIYHRKSDRFIEIIQFGKDTSEPKITVSCSIVYLGVDEEESNINHLSLHEYSRGDLSELCVDDCRDKFFLKGHFGDSFYFGDVYLALGRGIVAVSESSKRPFGIKIKGFKPEMYEKTARLIAMRLKSAYAWLTAKRAEKRTIPYQRIVDIMDDKQLDFGKNKYAHTVIYSKAHDKRYVIIYDENKNIFTYSLESIHLYDEEEWMFICHEYNAFPAYWSSTKDYGASVFGTVEDVMNAIEAEPTYREYFV